MLGYQTWAVCGFGVFVLEDYNSTTSALSLHPLFLATVLVTQAYFQLVRNKISLCLRHFHFVREPTRNS